MKWEDLKVYRPLTKEQLKPAYKHFTTIVANDLADHGFKKVGRRLLRLSNDLIQVIHLDTRGSWSGINEYFKIEIALVTICDTDVFLYNYELTGSKRLEELVPKLSDHYRITEEYELLANYITRIVIAKVLPYFNRYASSSDIVRNARQFEIGQLTERNENLVLYSELSNHTDKQASEIVSYELKRISQFSNGQVTDKLTQMKNYDSWLRAKDWNSLDNDLLQRKAAVLKKLKLKPAAK